MSAHVLSSLLNELRKSYKKRSLPGISFLFAISLIFVKYRSTNVRLSDRTARNGEDMMRILADYLSRYELLTPEKTESVLVEVEDTRCFQFNCHYRMEDRMELFRTTQ